MESFCAGTWAEGIMTGAEGGGGEGTAAVEGAAAG